MKMFLPQQPKIFKLIFLLFFFIEEQQEDDTPKPDWKPAPEIPREENRSGSNKKTYFVCNDRKFSLKSIFNN